MRHPARPDDRHVGKSLVHQPHAPDRDGADRRTGQAAMHTRQRRPARPHVDHHARQRVDHRQAVTARRHARPGDLRDVGHVRRQLREDRYVVPRGAADRHHHPRRRRGIEGEVLPGVLGVRAAEVDLDGGDTRRVRQPGRQRGVGPGGGTRDRHDRSSAAGQQPRQVPLQERVDSRSLQPDRADETRRRLRQPRRRVPGPGLERHRLGGHRADPRHVHELGELAADARAAGRGEYRAGQLDLPDPGPQVRRHDRPPTARPRRGAVSIRARRARRTVWSPGRPNAPGRRGTPGPPRRIAPCG